MLNETTASLYEEMRNYTRGTEISTPMLMLSEIMLRYAMENRIGLVLDRNFELYIQMARNLENPYHLYERKELEEFLDAIDSALEKEGYGKISDMITLLPFMYEEKENRRFKDLLGSKAFRTTYENFLKEDFKDSRNISSLLYTLSYQARKDLRDERSYSLGTLLSKALKLDEESIVKDELSCSELMLSSIAISTGARTLTENDNLMTRMLSPLSRKTGKIEEGEKTTLLLTDELPENLDEALEENARIAYFAPSALLLSSSGENLEIREKLIEGKYIESVIVLPPLTAAASENTSIVILSSAEKDKISFADLNSKSRDRNYFRDNQLTETSMEVIEKLLTEDVETEDISRNVSYEEVKYRKILVPMNYLETRIEVQEDTEELEKRIEELYGKLAALMEL